MGWFGPSGDCGCCSGCVTCNDYGNSLCFDIVGTTTGGNDSYANAIQGPSVATPVTLRCRWAYFDGSVAGTIFNQSGTVTFSALDMGATPPQATATATLSPVTFSIWLSWIVTSASAKPAAGNFYEYEVTLTPKVTFTLLDDCGQRTLQASFGFVAGSVTATPIAPLDPNGTTTETAITGNNGVFNSWFGESTTSVDCTLPLQADDLATGSDELWISTYSPSTFFPYFENYIVVMDFTPSGGYLSLSDCP